MLFVALFALTACGSNTEGNASSNNLQVEGKTVEYTESMVIGQHLPIALVNFNHVVVTAPEGSVLTYHVDMGEVKVSTNSENALTIDLVSAPAQVQISVQKCTGGDCPVNVHFVHQSIR